jgi:hypothetical protein
MARVDSGPHLAGLTGTVIRCETARSLPTSDFGGAAERARNEPVAASVHTVESTPIFPVSLRDAITAWLRP